MVRLLVVDDEKVVRRGIIESIPWQEYGIEIVGEATNGQHALEVIPELTPDVILADVRMPVMDGLDLADAVRRRYPAIIVVILTAYDDFSYAQRAIRAGVTDYLLKPAGSDELAHVLTGIRGRIQARTQDAEKLEIWSQLRKENLLGLRAGVFNEFIRGRCDAGQLKKRMKELDAVIEGNSYRVLSIQCARSAGKSAAVPMVAHIADTDMDRLVNQIEGGMGRGLRCVVVQREHTVLDAILSADDTEAGDPLVAIGKMTAKCEAELGFRLAVGVGRPGRTVDGVVQSYQDARHVLLNLPATSEHRVIEYNGDFERFLAVQLSHGYVPYPLEFEASILEAVQEADQPRCDQLLVSLSEDLKFRSVSLEHVRTTYVKLLVVIQTRIENLGELTGGSGNAYKTLSDESRLRTNMSELDQWLAESVRAAVSVAEASGLNRYSPVVRRTIRHAWQMCGTGITLQSIAKALDVSPNYLGHLFKKEVGRNFVSWLNSFRVQKAKQLLHDPRLKMYEVAARVGLQDSTYFHQLFRRETGINPTEYRRQHGL